MNFLKINKALLTLLLASSISFSLIANSSLYPGEKILTANGYPALVKFIKGSPKKPTVVFIPGFAHLARISYGYPTGNPKNFLSYWLNKKGYSFLGISYPLDNPVFSDVYPAFNHEDWGKQAADITKMYIKNNNLSNKVIIIGWSMGGGIAPTFNIAAEKTGIEVDFFIGLSSDPAIPELYPPSIIKDIKMAKNYLINTKDTYPGFIKAIELQGKLNNSDIIPVEIYKKQFLGNIPVCLFGSALRYKNNKWTTDIAEALSTSKSLDLPEYPFTTSIRNYGMYASQLAANAAILNQSSWGFIIPRKIFYLYTKDTDFNNLSPGYIAELDQVTNNSLQNLTEKVYGTHFFFIGEFGAKATAIAVGELEIKMNNYKLLASEFKNNLVHK